MKICRSQSLKPAEKHDQRRASEASVQIVKEPGPGPESGPKSGPGFGHEPEPKPGSEPTTESQKTAANKPVDGADVEDALPSAGASCELQPQNQAPGEIPAAEAKAVLPSGQGGTMGSEPSELKGDESESRVSPSESEVKQLDRNSR